MLLEAPVGARGILSVVNAPGGPCALLKVPGRFRGRARAEGSAVGIYRASRPLSYRLLNVESLDYSEQFGV